MRSASAVAVEAGGKAPAPTLIDSLGARARQRPSEVAVVHKRNGSWQSLTWSEVLSEVQILSAGLVACGVKPGERVAVFGSTTLQWILCDFAISAAGAVTIPIYGSNTPDECRYILDNSGAALLFVDHDEKDARQDGRLTRIRQQLDRCPSVRKVVVFEGAVSGERELSLADFRQHGLAAHQAAPEAYDARVARLEADEPCCFLYTSGTTGDPKGVMLTHGNWAYECQALQDAGIILPSDEVILFLPLAHVFAQVIKAGWVVGGYKLIIAESLEKLLPNIAESHPTVIPSVPRVFEKLYNGVLAKGSTAPGLKGWLFRWAMSQFDGYVEARQEGREASSLALALARRLVFSRVQATIQQMLGGRVRLCISGGAPLSPKIAWFFDFLGVKITEGYGLTETSAGTTVAPAERIKIGTVGPAVPGTEIRIAPDGEVLIRGGGVMKGYYKNPAATAEALEPDGWFHSGDIGELDADGYLRITDRKKDLIITAAGKNIAPQNLENRLKTFPLISQVMVYGDRRPYLTAFICVSEESARKLLEERGLGAAGYAELAKRPEIREAVQRVVDQVNAELPPYNTLKKFVLLDHDLSQEGGELTPTLKVKRKFCSQKYKALLDGLYEERAIE